MTAEIIKKQQKITLKGYYRNLPVSELLAFRTRIMEACGISEKTFYNYCNAPDKVAPGDRLMIETITGQKFDWDEN